MAFPAAPPLPEPGRRGGSERAPKVFIRPAGELDAEAIAAIYASTGTARGMLKHLWLSPDVWRERLAQDTRTARVHLVAEVVRGAWRRVVGSAAIVPVSDDPREKHVASLGIGVMDAWQGQGVGRALMKALLDHADHWAHHARVELHVFADNRRAIALYESLGFKREGTMRDSALREGGYVDSIVMGRLHPRLGEA
ncbi:MAG: GNAT family N-acetyltransferase [Casimicrobiaceae bacterium]